MSSSEASLFGGGVGTTCGADIEDLLTPSDGGSICVILGEPSRDASNPDLLLIEMVLLLIPLFLWFYFYFYL